MSRNPELRRNLWLEFTGNRVLIGAVLLPIVFATAAVADWSIARMARSGLDFAITATVAQWAFVILVFLWGGRQAAGAVVREIRNRTWDGQRLSSVRPWTMTTGKLFGATAYTWTLGLVCLLVYLAVSVYHGAGTAALRVAATMVGFGLVCHAVGLLLSLTRLSRTPGFRPANVTVVHLVALAATVALYYAAWTPGYIGIFWYGLDLAPAHFILLSAWLFALWGVVGIDRRMRLELQFRAAPWVWPLFLAFAVGYVNGIAHGIGLPGAHLSVSFVTLALFVYLLILFEPKDPQLGRRMASRIRGGRAGTGLRETPLWLIGFAALSLCSLAGVVLILNGVVDTTLVDGVAGDRFLLIQLIAAFLFVCRDVLIVLAFNLSRETRDGTAIAFIVLLVLWGPLPAILVAGRLTGVLTVFWPIGTYEWPLAVGPAALQVAAMIVVLAWRWRAYWRSFPDAQPS